MADINPSSSGDEEPLLDRITPDATRRLANAALIQFAKTGFHAATTREISIRAGVSAGALYNSFSTKEEILFLLSKIAHEESLERAHEARDAASGSSELRIYAIVEALARFHAEHYLLARVSQYELGSLSPQHRAEVQDVRNQVEFLLRYEIQTGLDNKEFLVPDARAAMRALLSLCVDISRWFGSVRTLTPEKVSRDTADLAVCMLHGATLRYADDKAARSGDEAIQTSPPIRNPEPS